MALTLIYRAHAAQSLLASKQCREDLDKLNQSYNELLERFNQLNKSCQKQSVFICPEDKKINETFKSNPQEPNRGTHFEYSFIALILILSISFPIKISLEDKLANRVMNFFIGTFMASMLVFGYIPLFNFWVKLPIAAILGIVVAVIVYKNQK